MIYRISINLYRYEYRIEKTDRYPALPETPPPTGAFPVQQALVACLSPRQIQPPVPLWLKMLTWARRDHLAPDTSTSQQQKSRASHHLYQVCETVIQ